MALVLAIAPVGPPALTLCAIADLADITEEIEGQIARIIFLAYIVTPFISTSVVRPFIRQKLVTFGRSLTQNVSTCNRPLPSPSQRPFKTKNLL